MDIASLFPVKEKCLYFNFAADGPMPLTAVRAVTEAVEERMNYGSVAVDKQVALYEDTREILSRLFGAPAECFAVTKNTSEGVLLALWALDIGAGENYVVAEDAFPTTVKAMEGHCRGQKRTVRINDPEPVIDQLRRVVDTQTRAIVLDWVHFFTGKVTDLADLADLARKNGAFTVIDGIQGAGALNLDLTGSGIDFFVSGGHKWLLSPQGTGFVYVSPRVWQEKGRKSSGWLGYQWGDFTDFDIQPPLRPGAAVMEYGTRSFCTGIGFLESLKIFAALGLAGIEAHNRGLREFFVEGVTAKGYRVISNHGAASTSIVPFKPADGDAAALKKRLEENDVRVSLRNGHIRAAFHFINHKEEVEQLLDLL